MKRENLDVFLVQLGHIIISRVKSNVLIAKINLTLIKKVKLTVLHVKLESIYMINKHVDYAILAAKYNIYTILNFWVIINLILFYKKYKEIILL